MTTHMIDAFPWHFPISKYTTPSNHCTWRFSFKLPTQIACKPMGSTQENFRAAFHHLTQTQTHNSRFQFKSEFYTITIYAKFLQLNNRKRNYSLLSTKEMVAQYHFALVTRGKLLLRTVVNLQHLHAPLTFSKLIPLFVTLCVRCTGFPWNLATFSEGYTFYGWSNKSSISHMV